MSGGPHPTLPPRSRVRARCIPECFCANPQIDSVCARAPATYPCENQQHTQRIAMKHMYYLLMRFRGPHPTFTVTEYFARRAFCYKLPARSSLYYRTCTVVEINHTIRWLGHVHIMGGLGATAARRSGLHCGACSTPLIFTLWIHPLAASHELSEAEEADQRQTRTEKPSTNLNENTLC